MPHTSMQSHPQPSEGASGPCLHCFRLHGCCLWVTGPCKMEHSYVQERRGLSLQVMQGRTIVVRTKWRQGKCKGLFPPPALASKRRKVAPAGEGRMHGLTEANSMP
eukprot:1159545-Pelagomonas_calceolata.AAC.4